MPRPAAARPSRRRFCASSQRRFPRQVPGPHHQRSFRTWQDLECQGGQSAGGVSDYAAGAVGQPTPEQAAREKLDLDGIDRDLLTERVSTDATGSTYVDYLSNDGRLVLYVEPQQVAGGTWLATYVYACASVAQGG